MASIERTAYPRFKRYFTSKELREIYTPTPAEIAFGLSTTQGKVHFLNLMVLLKAFQRLGYFPKQKDIPKSLVNHIRFTLGLPEDISVGYEQSRTMYRHRTAIREYLKVTHFNQSARHLAVTTVYKSASVMDNPADLINVAIDELIHQRYELPGFNTLDRLVRRVRNNVDYWTDFTRHFGPLSGSDPKLERATERYLLTTFTYGCNLGPTQAARHMRGIVTPRELSFVNRRHVSAKKLNAALTDVINRYNVLSLPKLWGDGTSAAADGTKYDLYEQNLLSEYHIRYGGYGGIAYHHVADSYVALFSHFIPCGTWEAVYIIDGLLKNQSDIQPEKIHADTQGQSTPVFALSYLLGIKLMPRIRNWQDLIFYRPDTETVYQHIDSLFKESIDWSRIATHWNDLLRVVLSIQTGKISSSILLRKLGNYSRKNRLYQAFQELGRVVRTVFLLQYISDMQLRQQITAVTNKVEAYHGFAKWFFFGGEGVIANNDPEEQEKIIKYNDLIANAVVFHNAVDLTSVLRQLKRESYLVMREDVAALSPYMTSQIKRFGDYLIDLDVVPPALDEGMTLVF